MDCNHQESLFSHMSCTNLRHGNCPRNLIALLGEIFPLTVALHDGSPIKYPDWQQQICSTVAYANVISIENIGIHSNRVEYKYYKFSKNLIIFNPFSLNIFNKDIKIYI